MSGIVTLKGKSQEKSVSTKNKAGQSGSKIKTVFCNDFLHGFCIDVKTSSSFRTKTWRPGNNLFYYQGRIPVPKPRVINVKIDIWAGLCIRVLIPGLNMFSCLSVPGTRGIVSGVLCLNQNCIWCAMPSLKLYPVCSALIKIVSGVLCSKLYLVCYAFIKIVSGVLCLH